VRYVEFVAPALLAASAMNGAVMESTFNIFAKLRFSKIYTAVLASPLEPRDIAVGELTWSLLRGGIYAFTFLVVTAVLGVATSWWAVLALPAALVIGFGFAGVGLTATTFMSSWQDFDLIQMVLMPLFLFSATFYPLEVYPPTLQVVAQISPLYHGVEMSRALVLTGDLATALSHVGWLVVFAVLLLRRRWRRRHRRFRPLLHRGLSTEDRLLRRFARSICLLRDAHLSPRQRELLLRREHEAVPPGDREVDEAEDVVRRHPVETRPVVRVREHRHERHERDDHPGRRAGDPPLAAVRPRDVGQPQSEHDE
jgi:lipooligosaccharide transport system permease protein